MSKGKRMDKNHVRFEEEKLRSLSLPQNPLETLEKIQKLKF